MKPTSICETQLTDEQQLKLIDWLNHEQMEYRPCAARIEREFGVKCGKDAVATFYKNVCWPLVLSRRSKARDLASGLETDEAEDSKIENALLSQLKQRAFEVMIQPNPDPKEIAVLLSMVLKLRDQKTEWAKVELKLRQYEDQLRRVRDLASQAKSKGGLTPETLAQIEEAAKLL